VIFDLDGTLLDTLDDLAGAMNFVLAQVGMPEHPVDAYRYFVGDGMEKLVRRALPPERLDPPTVSRALAAMRAEYDRRCADKTRPYPGVPELLDALTRRAVPFAVFSNKPHDAAVDLVRRLLGKWEFAAVVGARPGYPVKPDPAGALEVAEHLGAAPVACLYVGDTGTDMRTARAAGMRAVGALWGFRTAAELLEAGAQTLAASPADVLGLLASCGRGGATPRVPP
jgi:phosphoglycolate phosphatase